MRFVRVSVKGDRTLKPDETFFPRSRTTTRTARAVLS